MPKPRYNVKTLGKYPRSYDLLSQEDGENEEALGHAMEWLKDTLKMPKTNQEPSETQQQMSKIVDAAMEWGAQHSVRIKAITTAAASSTIKQSLKDILNDLKYGAKDLFAGRRIRTTLTITAGIGVGFAIGIVLGTLVFPGIGTALGALVGGGIAALVVEAGGALGLGILCAWVGSWLGKKISNKYKDEKHFELSHRITDKLYEEFKIDKDTADLMHGYLYNRKKSVESIALKEMYKVLRKGALDEADPVLMGDAVNFFRHELTLLVEERNPKHQNPALEKEIEAVLTILEGLKKAKKLTAKARTDIDKTLRQYHKNEAATPEPPHVNLGLVRSLTSRDAPEIPFAIPIRNSPSPIPSPNPARLSVKAKAQFFEKLSAPEPPLQEGPRKKKPPKMGPKTGKKQE